MLSFFSKLLINLPIKLVEPLKFLATLAVSAPLWLGFYFLIDLPLFVLGLPLTYILSKTESWHTRDSQFYPSRPIPVWNQRWAWLWGNEEDGVIGAQFWKDRNPTWSDSKLAFRWSGIRNNVNNLRYVPGLSLRVNPSKIKFLDYGKFTLTTHGFYSNLSYTGLKTWWQIGWKVHKEDASLPGTELPKTDMRYPGCGFGLRLIRS